MKRTHAFFSVLLAAILFAPGLGARAATVTATIDPPDISLGDTAQLTVTVTGSQAQANVPDVAGLDITAVGQSSQIQIINGSVTVNASTTYSISPQREGNFTIPAIRAGGAASQPVTLHVGKGNASASSQNLPPPSITPAPNSGPVVMPAPGSGPAPDRAPLTAQDRFGWLQVVMPKKELYIGELVPVEIKAYIRDGMPFDVRGLPEFTADGLTLPQLDNRPAQSNEVVGGRSYIVLTWHSAITAAKTGDYALGLKMPLLVVVPAPMPQGADDFNSFFQNAFAAMRQRKEVTLTNGADALKVLPLPAANRPSDFSGAVGQFEIDVSAVPTHVNAGDPITLRLRVAGKGNFDRVLSNGLPADANWKTYSPKSSFDPADSVGYQGTKTFEQPVIPNDSGVTSIPPVTFSYFNPETRQYVTRSAPPIAISVSGAPRAVASSAGPVVTPNGPAGAGSTPATPGPDSELAMNKFEPGTFFATLQPVYLSPAFLAAQAVPLVALFAGMFFVRRQRSGVDAQRQRTNAVRQAIRQQVDAMDEAIRNHQTHAFFISARAALQQRFGQDWGVRPETITVADVHARLGGEAEEVRPIFELADQASYSELHIGDADLAQWRTVVARKLAEKSV